MIAFFISRRKASMMEIKEHFQVPFYPLTPILALGICITLLIPIGSSGLITGGIWLLIGLALYLARYKTLNKLSRWD